MKDPQPYRVHFGAFELDLKSGELRNGDEKAMLREQSLQILRMLIERTGEIVTREEIRKKLWPNDTIVEFDHSINAAINKLRKLLGDSAEEPKYIETVARRGYRLMVPVEWVAREDSSDPTPTPAASPGQAPKEAEKGGAHAAGGDGAAVRMQPEPGTLTGQDGLPLSRTGHHRRRRHGRGVPCRGPQARPSRGAQVSARGAGQQSAGTGALQPRSAGGVCARPS